ncbi:MAG TPA: DUF6325 family protein [Micromonosporaceae bacterium]
MEVAVTDEDTMGPIDYLVIEFPGNRMTGEALPLLVDLVDRGIVKVLDLGFISKASDGSMLELSVSDIDSDAREQLGVFAGARSGLLSDEDLRDAANVIEPNSSAAILIYENVWAGPFAAALRRSGAQLVADGRIPVQALLAAIGSEG